MILTSRRNAFTLVEMLIVVVLIAVLAAIAIPHFQDASLRSKESALRADLKTLRNAVARFNADNACYPLSIDALALTSTPANCLTADGASIPLNVSAWRGPYLGTVQANPVTGNLPPTGYIYNVSPNPTTPVGTISAEAGSALNGTDYSAW